MVGGDETRGTKRKREREKGKSRYSAGTMERGRTDEWVAGSEELWWGDCRSGAAQEGALRVRSGLGSARGRKGRDGTLVCKTKNPSRRSRA